jgi:acetyl-CoA carboxylase biotin carboxylase subunit
VLSDIQNTAVRIAQCVNYKNAGTVEFLLSKDNKFYFMEMNTRIQVEHPVTESIFGVDLIKAQIQVALGHHLTVPQEEIIPRGHSIECRINAENVRQNFQPSPGRIKAMNLPGGCGVRIDTGFAAGDEISPFYDSMIMKIICSGDDRSEAVALSMAALDELHIDGVAHNTEFTRAILADIDFLEGRIHTKWIEKVFLIRFSQEKL